jgi:hypothetical protein
MVRLLCLPLVLALGCASPRGDNAAADENEIVLVPQTEVERQAIGISWIYAHASWVESMHKKATGQDFDASESYWTYWHWFDQIVAGGSAKISTGGNWTTANDIVRKYGLMSEADFVSQDTTIDMSARQKQALDALDASLASGALADLSARRDKTTVRREMDRAWGLTPDVSAMLDRVFGEDVTKTFESTASPADAAGTKIVKATEFAVAYTTGPGLPLAQMNSARVVRAGT